MKCFTKILIFILFILPISAFAGEINSGDTSWILTATALVLLMTLPGLALFYGGLVRSKNVLSVLMHCIAVACLMSILWVVAGYSIAFGDGSDMTPYWGGLSKLFLSGINSDSLSGSIPESVFSGFQMTFAVITPALIIGAFVERIKFSFVLIFSSLWMLLCYAPVTHWVWGTGGFLLDLGTVDLAGGLVVHETAGLAALVVAYFLGSRKDKSKPPHNPAYVMIGTCLLWVGWFGFNAGSQLAANGSAGMTLLVTHLSAASASLSWAAYEYFKHGKASLVGLATGTIAGLATITPASGSVSPMEAILIGAFVGVVCQEMCSVVKNKFNVDDSLDVFAVHGMGGIIGTLSIAFFGYAGWYEQLVGVTAVGLYTIAITTVIVLVAKSIVPIRANEDEEQSGLDLAEHGEKAYNIE
jgi:Amt family ammonium transporter|tara:strand:- start:8809 stop:10047 length:1239 start_codon:yes stop_codon:yes gene_type:complete